MGRSNNYSKLFFKQIFLITILFSATESFGQEHFVIAYTGNGQDQMNINIIEANIGGVALIAGDEIAVFDDTICCGKVILSQPIDINNISTYVSIAASKADDGIANGYKVGDPITIKFWDSGKQKEMSGLTTNFINTNGTTIASPTFTVNESSFVELSVAALTNQLPVSNAGIDQSVIEGCAVTLDGSGSTDPDYDDLTYTWNAPAGITLSSTTAVKPTFTAPKVSVETNYAFTLIVNDGTANSVADQIIVTVRQENQPTIDKTSGNTEVFSSVNTSSNRRAMPVTFSDAGEIQSISIYHDGGTGNVLLGVYSDQTGLPSSQLGVTSATVVNTTAGWQTVSLTSPVPVVSGQKVWLAWVFEKGVSVRYTSGTPSRAQASATWSSGLPAAFGTATILGNKFSIYCTYSPRVITTTLGNTEVFSSANASANRRAMPVTFTESGEIQSISIYHSGGTGNVLLGVYSDQSGLPSSQLGVTSATVVNTTAGWQTVSLTSPVPVVSGQKVWLAWVFEKGVSVRYTSGTPSRAQSSATWSSGMPTTFGTATTLGNKFSIYCTYSPRVITSTLGNTEVFSSVNTSSNRRAMPVTFSEAGEIQSISIYHGGGTGNVLLGVYSDQSGLPSSQLGVTSATVVNTTAGWQTVSLTSPVPVVSGQKVWLAWVFEKGVSVRYTSGTPSRAQSSATWSSGLPTTFGTATTLGNKFSIYCTYTNVASNQLKSADIILGIDSIYQKNAEMLIYPNPTKGDVNIVFSNTPEANSWITIFDISGRLISKIQATDIQQSFNMSGNKAGLYFIKFSQKGSKTYKLILE